MVTRQGNIPTTIALAPRRGRGRTSVSHLLLPGGASKSLPPFSAPGECFQHLRPQLPPKGRPMWDPSPTNAPHVGAPSTTYGPFPYCPALQPGWNHTQDLSDRGTVTGLISLLTLRRASPPLPPHCSQPLLKAPPSSSLPFSDCRPQNQHRVKHKAPRVGRRALH